MTDERRRRPVKRLEAGSRVCLVSPCSPPYPERLALGVRMLESWGLVVDVLAAAAAGAEQRSPQERAHELQTALADPTCDAVLVTRAGHGAGDLIGLLDLAVLDAQPKYFGGFSDVAHLHVALGATASVPCFHTPEIAWNSRLNGDGAAESLRRSLMGDVPPVRPVSARVSAAGPSACGELRGGTISTLAQIDAAPPGSEGVVLLLEDVRESAASVKTLLTAVERRGHTEGVSAIAIGQFAECDDPDEVTDTVRTWAEQFASTCIWDLPIGHGVEQQTVPLNWLVEIDTGGGTLAPVSQPTDREVTWS